MTKNKIRIGTRGSPLALWQSNWIKSRLQSLHAGLKAEIVPIKTSGDKIQDVALAKIGGKGLFVKEIEEALLSGQIDIAVHSMKDVPVKLPAGLNIVAIPSREDPRDALISKNDIKLKDLPRKARIGTGSLRRITQLLNYRPDLEIVPLRGNVETRIKKITSEALDGIVLAVAGLRRMGMEDKISEAIDPGILLPAVGQGAIGVEARQFDADTLELVLELDHEETHIALEAERAFLRALGGGCQVPIGAYATLDGDRLTLKAVVGSLDGKQIFKSEKTGVPRNAQDIGESLGKEMLEQGAGKLLDEIYQ
ncbi:MAG: hydroxymethylbilane synthase [Nitrospinae bacterium]|nr:hydroxymethylbilane synthase [Nitrospinota bacterium]